MYVVVKNVNFVDLITEMKASGMYVNICVGIRGLTHRYMHCGRTILINICMLKCHEPI